LFKYVCQICNHEEIVEDTPWWTEECGSCGSATVWDVFAQDGNKLATTTPGDLLLWATSQKDIGDSLAAYTIAPPAAVLKVRGSAPFPDILPNAKPGECDICHTPNEYQPGPFRCFLCKKDPLGRLDIHASTE
jgi:hypothetical protein